jgi:hypothetical protein
MTGRALGMIARSVASVVSRLATSPAVIVLLRLPAPAGKRRRRRRSGTLIGVAALDDMGARGLAALPLRRRPACQHTEPRAPGNVTRNNMRAQRAAHDRGSGQQSHLLGPAQSGPVLFGRQYINRHKDSLMHSAISSGTTCGRHD